MIYHKGTPLDRMREEVEALGSQAAWADKYGFSCAYVNDILRERRPMSDAVAKALGFERVTTWKSIDTKRNP